MNFLIVGNRNLPSAVSLVKTTGWQDCPRALLLWHRRCLTRIRTSFIGLH
jgi:hypothetical protein